MTIEADRDANAAWNIRSRGIKKRLGVGHSESTSSESQGDSDVQNESSALVNACGDCTPYGHRFGVCKVRHGSRKFHHQNLRFWLAVRSSASDDTPQA